MNQSEKQRLEDLENFVKNLKYTGIDYLATSDCPKCEHETIQRQFSKLFDGLRYCLNCGSYLRVGGVVWDRSFKYNEIMYDEEE